ncbi:5'-methylthioadenosine/S-adenosylhomocysteine nucleosidase [Halodurantibacterium flavum]|uniref:5'-methylthioadenosine/S-adenosylhomocysteine nucleosidase n=1 Tax=Halodurantibacterium flavum TaxID=1382802 RepID=A0ABW4S064_9RHOB
MTEVMDFGGRSVLFVMAARAEYGPELRARINPLITGIGPVEAAVALTRALAQMRHLPDLVVSLGSAGSARLTQGEVYQVSRVGYRDMDASPLGFAVGETPFLGLPAELDLPCPLENVPSATLSTGGNIVSGAAYGRINADMVDMETYALLRACMGFGLPLIALRGVSDGAAELRRIDDWTALLPLVDRNLAHACDQLAEVLAAGWEPALARK